MAAYSMYANKTEIRMEDFEQIPREKDIITRLEETAPGLRCSIMAYFNHRLKCWDPNCVVADVKYIREGTTFPLKFAYLTKERNSTQECNSTQKFRYVKYVLNKDPMEIYLVDMANAPTKEELFQPILAKIKMEPESQAQSFVFKYQQKQWPFSHTDMLLCKKAQNPVCATVELKPRDKLTKLCLELIRERQHLIPFCQECGSTYNLWNFGVVHIYCWFCFRDKFGEKPLETTKKLLLREALLETGDIPYSRYLKYISMRYSDELEYHLLDEANYQRGRKLLTSPKFKEMSMELSEKQRKRLYALSVFFIKEICMLKRESNIISFAEHTFLLIGDKNE